MKRTFGLILVLVAAIQPAYGLEVEGASNQPGANLRSEFEDKTSSKNSGLPGNTPDSSDEEQFDLPRVKAEIEKRHTKMSMKGFQSIYFGDSRSAVIRKLSAKYNYRGLSGQGFPQFEGTFAGRRNCTISVALVSNKFVSAQVLISPTNGVSMVDLFIETLKDLHVKYGFPDGLAIFRRKNSIASEIEGTALLSLKLSPENLNEVLERRAFVNAIWFFNDGNMIMLDTPKSANGNPRGWISIEYRMAKGARMVEQDKLKDY